mgnify:CR=1 FL=1
MLFDPQSYLSVEEAFTLGPIDFIIVAVHDISHSNLSQLDKWKEIQNPNTAAVDRLNRQKGLVREVNLDENPGLEHSEPQDAWNTTYRLTLCDTESHYCFAYEYNDKLSFLRGQNSLTTPPVGGKMRVLKGTLIMNGVLMLNRAQCQYLGMENTELSRNLALGIATKHIEFLSRELGL